MKVISHEKKKNKHDEGGRFFNVSDIFSNEI